MQIRPALEQVGKGGLPRYLANQISLWQPCGVNHPSLLVLGQAIRLPAAEI